MRTVWSLIACLFLCVTQIARADEGLEAFKQSASLFQQYCFDCHGDGSAEGDFALDELSGRVPSDDDRGQWVSVWENLRAQIMPPFDESQPTEAERKQMIDAIQRGVFRLNPAKPDPGRVTIRRLNRQEYHYTILDLLGIEFETTDTFPADDTGYGFDTIGDVLSISPLLMEKYLEAARAIVADAVHTGGPQVPSQSVWADRFRSEDKKSTAKWVPFAKSQRLRHEHFVQYGGPYRLRLELRVAGSDAASANSADLVMYVNDEPLSRKTLGWDFNNMITLSADATLGEGKNEISLEIVPKDPPDEGEKPLFLVVRKLDLSGPTDGTHSVYPPQYERIFMDGPPPEDSATRREYARKILRHFADRAFRRPVDDSTLDRLVAIAGGPDLDVKEFEKGIARAMTAILVSPRFLFRAEVQPEPNDPDQVVRLDEFSLASRLSYFLWSSMPDDELLELAGAGKLRENLRAQTDRLIDDPKSSRFVENFVGQWLQTRDIETINVDAQRVLSSSSMRKDPRDFNARLRQAMKSETELMFSHLLREDRSVLELLTADYTFLNEPLANWYGIDGVEGNEMRRTDLTGDHHRGGLLTHSSFLLVSSNPARTSPVKRGLFVLENLLGMPAPPPPGDVPTIEEVQKREKKKLSMREVMEIHREDTLCASCHARMDPVGLALERYNALGLWRENDNGQPIDTKGKLITGEPFADVAELSHLIANQRRQDFYRCLSEKSLTYALGRGVEYFDAPAIDRIVRFLESNHGNLRTLIYGIVTSTPFQLRRGDE